MGKVFSDLRFRKVITKIMKLYLLAEIGNDLDGCLFLHLIVYPLTEVTQHRSEIMRWRTGQEATI